MDQISDFSWEPINLGGYANFENLLSAEVVQHGPLYWRRVRPFFFRPLVEFEEYDPAETPLPVNGVVGLTQHAVPPTAPANSRLNFLFFEDTRNYSSGGLDRYRRKQLNQAARHFAVRRIVDLSHFQKKAHPVFLSFYERTHYEYGSQRRDPAEFARWAEALFRLPGVLILGGYEGDELVGVSLSFLLKDTVIYTSFFCTTDSMRRFLADLVLHAIRSAAAANPAIARISVGMYKGNKGLDDFKFLRGATCVQKRALIRGNPLARMMLKIAWPRAHAKLVGVLPDSFPSSVADHQRP